MNGNKIQKQLEPFNAAKKFIQEFWRLLATEIDPINIKNAFFTRNNNHIFERNGRFNRSIFYWWKTCGLIIGFKVGGWQRLEPSTHLARVMVQCILGSYSIKNDIPNNITNIFLWKTPQLFSTNNLLRIFLSFLVCHKDP